MTDEDLANIKRLYPPENNFVIRLLVEEVERLRAQVRHYECVARGDDPLIERLLEAMRKGRIEKA